MIVILSPAKSLNLSDSNRTDFTLPALQSDANKLVKALKKFSSDDLQDLMNISEQLAQENYLRFKRFKLRAPLTNSKRALEIFAGDVYRGLNVQDFVDEDYEFAQRHLRILSGLYGVLRPLDKIQPYRLEMGTRLNGTFGKNLYEFWGDKITSQINKALKDIHSDVIVNLASEEYFKSIKKKKVKAKILQINFKEYHNGSLKFLSFNAKVARGQMARYIIKNRLIDPLDIKGFAEDKYVFSRDHSTEDNWLFIR